MKWFHPRREHAAAPAQGAAAQPRTVERRLGRGTDLLDAVRERVSLLCLIDDARVCVPERVVTARGGDIVTVMPVVEGSDLDSLLGQRGHLSVGECVTVGVQLCGALEAMHAVGLAHGDVSTANVMVGAAGCVLVDTVAGAMPHESGTAGYAAPERGNGATFAADVYSVGAVLAECIEPSHRTAFMGWLDPLMDPDPARRPSAGAVAGGLQQCARPLPVIAPQSGVVSQMRAHAREPRARTVALRSGRGWRIRRHVARYGIVVAAVVALVAGVLWLTEHADRASADPGPAGQVVDAPIPDPRPMASAAESAKTLTRQRFDALAAGDADALMATVVAGSVAAEQVGAQADALRDHTVAFVGLSVQIVEVTIDVADDDASARGDVARVAVKYDVAAHTVVRGESVTTVAAHRESVVLQLESDGTTWRVARALPQS